MSEVKFCKDCKFYVDVGSHWRSFCGYRPFRSFVTGEIHKRNIGACVSRMSELYCGQEAKYFEPRGKVDE